MVIVILQIAAGLALYACTLLDIGAGICIVYGAIMLLTGLAVPLVNTAGVAFPGEVNFGMARATGSFGYASASVYYARQVIPETDQSKAQAYMANALTIGTVIGALVGGRLIEAYHVNVMLVFQTAVAALGLAGMVIWKSKYTDTAKQI